MKESRPDKKHEREEAGLVACFAQLRAAAPDADAAAAAVAAARARVEAEFAKAAGAAVEGGAGGRGPKRERVKGLNPLIWRIAMPAGLLVAAAVGLMFVLSTATTQVASAAEVLARAEAARDAYDGWYTLEVHDPETGDWQMEQRVNPAAGRSLVRLAADPAVYTRGILESDWLYIDRQAPLTVWYTAEQRRAQITGWASDQYLGTDLPLSVEDMRLWPELEERYDFTTRKRPGGGVELVMDKRPLSAAEATAAAQASLRTDGGDGYPQQIVAEFAADTGLLQFISVQENPADAVVPYARLLYDAAAIEDWRELLDESVTVDDRRPDDAASALLERLDDLWARGPGFATAVVTSRGGDPVTGQLTREGQITLYAERDLPDARAWVKFSWRGVTVADYPQWPEVDFAAVQALLSERSPDSAVVYDGRRGWWRWDRQATEGRALEGGGWHTAAEASTPGFVLRSRLVGELWPSRADVMMSVSPHPTRPTVRPWPGQDGLIALESVTEGQWAGAPAGKTAPMQRMEAVFYENLGLLPARRVEERFNAQGEISYRTTTLFGSTSLAMYREPVRVPLNWRQTVTTDPHEMREPYANYYHLIPLPGVTLGAEWFGDPRVRGE